MKMKRRGSVDDQTFPPTGTGRRIDPATAAATGRQPGPPGSSGVRVLRTAMTDENGTRLAAGSPSHRVHQPARPAADAAKQRHKSRQHKFHGASPRKRWRQQIEHPAAVRRAPPKVNPRFSFRSSNFRSLPPGYGGKWGKAGPARGPNLSSSYANKPPARFNRRGLTGCAGALREQRRVSLANWIIGHLRDVFVVRIGNVEQDRELANL